MNNDQVVNKIEINESLLKFLIDGIHAEFKTRTTDLNYFGKQSSELLELCRQYLALHDVLAKASL